MEILHSHKFIVNETDYQISFCKRYTHKNIWMILFKNGNEINRFNFLAKDSSLYWNEYWTASSRAFPIEIRTYIINYALKFMKLQVMA